MISVSGLRGLLDQKRFDEFEKIVLEHFNGPEKLDIIASGKLLNIVSFFVICKLLFKQSFLICKISP